MRGNRGTLRAGAIVGLAVGLLLWPGRAAIPASPAGAEDSNSSTNAPSAAANDLLQFLDGSLLHGSLRGMTTDQGVVWDHPDARTGIKFRPDNLAWIRFEKPRPIVPDAKPTCRFRFNNGDEVFGDLAAIHPEHLELRTWFGGQLKTPRKALQAITFLSKGYAILYEGPTSPEGWVHGKSGRGWEYRDGSYVASGIGTLGRDLKLNGSSSIAFDLSWNGQFSLILAIYTSVLDRFDYSSTSYMFYFSPGYVSLQRVGGAGAMNLGQAAISEMARKNRLRVEIRANKDDSTFGLLIDDRLVQRWKDGAGFLAQGSGVVFFQQLEGPSVRISNLKVAQWEGDSGMDVLTSSPAKDDVVYLVNRDRVSGTLQSMGSGSVSIATGQSSLDIPLSRVTQITLGSPQTNAAPSGPWELRAYFAGGGTVAFDLERWESAQVTGRSANFGEITFNPQFIRQLQFNLNRSKAAAGDMEIVDQDVWELE